MRYGIRLSTLSLAAATSRGFIGLIRANHLPIHDCDTKLDRCDFPMILISIDVGILFTHLKGCRSVVGGPKEILHTSTHTSASSSLEHLAKTDSVPDIV